MKMEFAKNKIPCYDLSVLISKNTKNITKEILANERQSK